MVQATSFIICMKTAYICVLEDATVEPDTSSAAVQVLDSSSGKTSCSDEALSSAMEKEKIRTGTFSKPQRNYWLSIKIIAVYYLDHTLRKSIPNH